MSDFNIGSDWKTKISKGDIRENEYVKVSKHGDWKTYCTVCIGSNRIFNKK